MSDEPDLTGAWIGTFDYPTWLPPNHFEATLRDIGGAIAGVTSERDDKPDGHGAVLTAVIEGRREGHAIEFRKLYDDLSRCDGFVAYSGTIYPDGNEISGRWEIAGVWSGTFIMIRKSGARETFAREAEERADQEAIAQVGTSVIARCVSAVAIQSRHLDCRAASPLAMTIFPSTGRIG